MQNRWTLLASIASLVLVVSCGSQYPSARLGDLAFYVTGVQVVDSKPGFSQMRIQVVAENTGNSPVPFPKYTGYTIQFFASMTGKVGSETYNYGAAELSTPLNSLPPHFRLRDEVVFEVAKTSTEHTLKFEMYERCPLCMGGPRTAVRCLSI